MTERPAGEAPRTEAARAFLDTVSAAVLDPAIAKMIGGSGEVLLALVSPDAIRDVLADVEREAAAAPSEPRCEFLTYRDGSVDCLTHRWSGQEKPIAGRCPSDELRAAPPEPPTGGVDRLRIAFENRFDDQWPEWMDEAWHEALDEVYGIASLQQDVARRDASNDGAAPPEPQVSQIGDPDQRAAPPEPPQPDPAWKRLHAAASKTFSEAREDSDLYDALKESHEALMRLSGADASALPLDVELLKEVREFLGRSLDDIGANRWTLVEKIDARLSPSSGESEPTEWVTSKVVGESGSPGEDQ